MQESCATLLGAGHAVHLGLTSEVEPARLTALWEAWPHLSIGHAVPRRDRWRRLAETLGPPLARSLPPDLGILAYLRQLDLDLVLLGEAARAGAIEAEYLRACEHLRLAVAEIGETAETVLVQAGPGAVPAPAPQGLAELYLPALWAALAFDDLAHPPDSGPAADRGGASGEGLGARLQDAYARRIFPALAASALAMAPTRRPLLKAGLGERLDPGGVANEMSAEQAMIQAAEGRGLVVLGPWWDDADLELLYWIPFLRWWRRHYQVDKERIVVVSSGGARPWYDGLAGQYFDLTELYDPPALADLDRSRREELAQRKKRFGVTDADRQIVKRLDRRLGFRGLKVLPSWTMAVTFERYWSGQAGPALLSARTRPQAHRIKEKRARQLVPGLPAAYVAFGLPDRAMADPEVRTELETMVRRAADRTRVVVLAESGSSDSALRLGASGGRIQPLLLDPATAKSTASAVLAAATAYLGPAGWMAYAAAAYGRPAICLRSGADERELIDLAAASRLFAPPPVWIGLADIEAAAALDMVVADRAPIEAAH